MSIFRSRHILFSMVFGGVRVADLFRFLCCPILCPYFPSSVPWCPLWFPHKNDVQLFFFYLKLIVGGLRSYLRYLCLLAYSDVQHILCCVFDLFVFVLCNLCCQLFWIVPSVFSNIHLLSGLTLTYDVTVHWHMMWLSTDIWCDCPLTWCDCPLTYDVTVHWHMMWLSTDIWCDCPKPAHGFQSVYIVTLFCLILWWSFYCNCGIVHHHC